MAEEFITSCVAVHMYKFVFLLAVLLAESAFRVNAECTEDGLDCILDEQCCTGYCDWKLSYYPYSGGCAPRPSGPIPSKPCIPLGTGQTCVYNVTCCEGYCETRFTTEGFCVIGAPPGFFSPEPSPAPIASEIFPIVAANSPAPTPVYADLAPTPHSRDVAHASTPSSVAASTPVPTKRKGKVAIASPSPSRKNGSKLTPGAPNRTPSKKGGKHTCLTPIPSPTTKNMSKHKSVTPIRAPSKKDVDKHKHVALAPTPSKKAKVNHKKVAPTPAPLRNIETKKKNKNHGNEQLKYTSVIAPSPA